jgi:hypothetical protein
VADIDVAALRRALPGRIRTFQDFVAFIDAARELRTIEVVPPLADRPDAVQRLAAEHARYLVDVDRPDRAGRHVYDITDIVEPIRAAALARLDADLRAEVATLTADQRWQVHRLRRGPATPIYRSAQTGWKEQLILSSQRLFGPDPWVRVVGADLDVGGPFSTTIRVRVTPANADAERAALFAAYYVFEDIKHAYAEVVAAGRPILDRQPPGGENVLTSFVAGPKPGDPRFGVTRYVGDPDPESNLTAAVGELNEFWVARDDLEQVPAKELERYGLHR